MKRNGMGRGAAEALEGVAGPVLHQGASFLTGTRAEPPSSTPCSRPGSSGHGLGVPREPERHAPAHPTKGRPVPQTVRAQAHGALRRGVAPHQGRRPPPPSKEPLPTPNPSIEHPRSLRPRIQKIHGVPRGGRPREAPPSTCHSQPRAKPGSFAYRSSMANQQ